MNKKILMILVVALTIVSMFVLIACTGGSGNSNPSDDNITDGGGSPSNPDDGDTNNNDNIGGGEDNQNDNNNQDGEDNDPDIVLPTGLAFQLSKDKSFYTVTGIGGLKDKDIVIPNTNEDKPVSEIASNAFKGKQIEKLTISANIKKIGAGAFQNCHIKEVLFNGTAEEWSAISKYNDILTGNNFQYIICNDAYILPDGTVKNFTEEINYIENIDGNSYAAYHYYGNDEEVVIPNQVNNKPVTVIGDRAFYQKKTLKTVYMSTNAKMIGKSAFENCSSLDNIVWGKDLQAIGDLSFKGTRLEVSDFPDSILYVGYDAILVRGQRESSIVYVGKAAYRCVGVETPQELTIKEGTVSISEGLFLGGWQVSRLQKINFPVSLKYVGDDALASTGWFKNQNAGVVYINNIAYAYKKPATPEKTVEIKAGTEVIVDNFLKGNRDVESVSIPSSVKYIGEGAFTGGNKTNSWDSVEPTNIKSISIDSANTNYEVVNNCLIEKATNTLIVGNTNSTIPENIKRIGKSAFASTRIESVVIPDSVRYIGDYAFDNCASLRSVTFGSNLKVIGKDAFNYCSLIGNLNLPKSLEYIMEFAFANCSSVNQLSLGENIKKIDRGAFQKIENLSRSKGGRIELSNLLSFMKIDFEHDNYDTSSPLQRNSNIIVDGRALTNLVIPREITKIPTLFFSNCECIQSVTFHDGVTEIGTKAFSSSGLTTINWGTNIASIGESAFAYTDVVNLTLPSSITELGKEAFYNCKALRSIVISDNMDTIKERTFQDCNSLEEVTLGQNLKVIGKEAFLHADNLRTINSNNSAIIEIGKEAFVACSKINNIDFATSAQKIGSNAFDDTQWFINQTGKEVYIGNVYYNYVGEVPNNAYIYVKEGTIGIAGGAFSLGVRPNGDIEATNNFTVVVPSSVKYIGDYAFNGQKNATINIDFANIESIGECAFVHCNNITSASLTNEKLTTIGAGAFKGCTGLNDITIGSKITTIGSDAFNGCTNLTSITIPVSVTKIDYSAFADCTNLTTVNYLGTVEQWKAVAAYQSVFYNDTLLTAITCSNGSVPI